MKLPRLYPIVDTALLSARQFPVIRAVEALLAGSVEILQYRHKGPYTRCTYGQVERVAELCRAAGVSLIVNDRADIARLLNAGLHLGQTDLPPTAARRVLGDTAVLGFSTHNEPQLRTAAAEPADYLALGPIQATSSKERSDPVVGVENLRLWRSLSPRPLVAIGGVTRANARTILDAGADSVAVISDLFPDPLNEATLARRIEEWQQAVML